MAGVATHPSPAAAAGGSLETTTTATTSSSSTAPAAAASGSSFDLDYMVTLLSALGNPQQQYPIVHVAGTKGKGSVVALLSAMLRAAGFKVGAYTSPHLLHAVERIQGPQRQGGPISITQWRDLERAVAEAAARVSGFACSDDQVPNGVTGASGSDGIVQTAAAAGVGGEKSPATTAVLGEEAVAVVDSTSSRAVAAAAARDPTYFEAVTAMAFKHFADAGVDVAVIETGLGGATDATNVIGPEQLQLAVITSLGMDHVQALGGSLASIAAAKAGIMKEGRPVVIAAQRNNEQLEVLLRVAGEKGCPVVMTETAVQVKGGGGEQRGHRGEEGECLC
jgi:folylpolyglutamate synthase/dihydropteroate synthase